MSAVTLQAVIKRAIVISLLFTSVQCFASNIKSQLIKAYFDSTSYAILPLSQEVIDANVKDAEFWYYKGLCEKQINDHFSARESYHWALRNNYQHEIAVLYNLAIAEANLGNTSQAMNYLYDVKQHGLSDPKLLARSDFDIIRNEPAFVEYYAAIQPHFSIWSLAGLLFILLSIGLIIKIKQQIAIHNKANYWLLALLVVFALCIAESAIYWSGSYSQFPYLRLWREVAIYLVGPLLYLYFNGQFKLKTKRILLHFVPALTAFVLLLPTYVYFLNTDVSNSLMNNSFFLLGSALVQLGWLQVLYLGFYALAIFITFLYNLEADNTVKNWLKPIYIGYLLILVSFIFYHITESVSFVDANLDFALLLGQVAIVLGIGYMSFFQPKIFKGALSYSSRLHVVDMPKYEKSSLSQLASIELKHQLIKAMEIDAVYTDSNLNLDKLVAILGSTRHNVSQVINEQFGCNYFDFINRYRIRYAEELLCNADFKDYTINEILYKVGFNNKVSFNNAFKKFTGQTATAYRKIKAIS